MVKIPPNIRAKTPLRKHRAVSAVKPKPKVSEKKAAEHVVSEFVDKLPQIERVTSSAVLRPPAPTQDAHQWPRDKYISVDAGMSPLEFLTCVYRDQLYDRYDESILYGPGNRVMGRRFQPARDATKLLVLMEERVKAAVSAAPYVHSKMPTLVASMNVTEPTTVDNDLSKLSAEELQTLLAVMDKLETSE